MLTLILGGARSGKSRLAQRLASSKARVSYIATAEHAPTDPEMTARISRHQADRPPNWKTIEEPIRLAQAVEEAASDADVILVDCLTIWLSNLLWLHRDAAPDRAEQEANAQLEAVAAARTSDIILVSNEVGSGIVPESAVGRAFRDLQGLVNQRAAALADEVILVTAGLSLYLKSGKI